MDVSKMTPISSGKKTAGTNAGIAKGAALAIVCVAYATKVMQEEEKRGQKLRMIIKSIADLTHDAHVEFRAELSKELQLVKELQTATKTTSGQMRGYSLSSFTVLVSNWKTISTACELGYKPEDKSWPVVVAESVQMKQAHASNGKEGAQLPIKRKAGRKATPELEKAQTAASKLSDEDFMVFLAWAQEEVTTRANQEALV